MPIAARPVRRWSATVRQRERPRLTHIAISSDGTTIAYDRAGSGPTLLFVTGVFNDRSTCAELANLLEHRFTLVTYERRRHGDSADTSPYSIDREIDDIDSLIAGAELVAQGRRGDAIELFQRRGIGLDAVAQIRRAPFWPALEPVAPTVDYDATITRRGALPVDVLASITTPPWYSPALRPGTSSATPHTPSPVPCPPPGCAPCPRAATTSSPHALAPALDQFFTDGQPA